MLHNVVITFTAEKPINSFRIDGPEITDQTGESYITGGRMGSNFLQITLGRVIQESNIPITLLTPQGAAVSVVVASDETPGIKTEPKTKAGILDYLILLISAFALGFYVYSTLKQRHLITVGACTTIRREAGTKLIDTLVTHRKSLAAVIIVIEAIATNKLGDNPDVGSDLKDVCSVLEGSIQTLQSFTESISTDGVCLELADKKANAVK